NIRTIHSFCQSLLQQFAFEANLPPGFTLLDEGEGARLRAQALRDLLASAPITLFSNSMPNNLSGADPFAVARAKLVAEAFAVLSHHHHHSKLQQLLDKLLSQPPLPTKIEGFDRYCMARGLDPHYRLDHAQRHHAQQVMASKEHWHQLGIRLSESARVTDQQRGQGMIQLVATGLCNANFADWQLLFLTQDLKVRTKLATNDWQKTFPDLHASLVDQAAALMQLVQADQAWCNARWRWAIGVLSHQFAAQYQQLKTLQAKVDYNDLIEHSQRLLQQADLQPWILMRLDQQWDHLLIDEAQDTSNQHWDIIRTLLAELAGQQVRPPHTPMATPFATTTPASTAPAGTASAGANPPPGRSLFVVGDVKQSIYGFQGADPASFQAANLEFRQQWQAANLPWQDVSLQLSYRSSPPILRLVDAVFNHQDQLYRHLGEKDCLNHQAHPNRHGGGRVVLWPLCPAVTTADLPPWTLPIQRYQRDSNARRLANFLADTIADWLAQGRWLPSVQRAVQPRDILILLQRRTAGGQSDDQKLLYQLRRALQQRAIPVSLSDNMVLANELAVQDLLAFMQVLMTPDDDYSLACVLKSPLIGWDDQALFDLAFDRPQKSSARQSLWQTLLLSQHHHPGHAALVRWLHDWMAKVDWLTPYQLLSQLLWQPLPALALATLDDGAQPVFVTGWQAMVAAFGQGVEDVLTSLLAAAQSYEQRRQHRGISGLEFMLMIQKEWGVSKRQSASADRNEVRLLTVHGAKGLQAPIVILPDTTSQPPPRDLNRWLSQLDNPAPDAPLGEDEWDDSFESDSDGDDDNGQIANGDDQVMQDDDWLGDDPEPTTPAEALRMLYVALTRAQDELYITGLTPRKKAPKKSSKKAEKKSPAHWYNLIKGAMDSLVDAGQASMQEFSYRFSADAPAPPLSKDQDDRPTDADADSWTGCFYEIRS
ncbi:MAG: hypothetical protein FJX22_00335, partial [Alphaproteobacteria bacterium]|nr:hypothetical protein [Alphaproteobacteria bacterium]